MDVGVEAGIPDCKDSSNLSMFFLIGISDQSHPQERVISALGIRRPQFVTFFKRSSQHVNVLYSIKQVDGVTTFDRD
jgi:hypothetical protein